MLSYNMRFVRAVARKASATANFPDSHQDVMTHSSGDHLESALRYKLLMDQVTILLRHLFAWHFIATPPECINVALYIKTQVS